MRAFPPSRTVVVTGAASSRLGRATADLPARRGRNVGVVDLDQGRCDAPAADLVFTRQHLAAAVASWISEEAGFISGQTSNVDGGLSMR